MNDLGQDHDQDSPSKSRPGAPLPSGWRWGFPALVIVLLAFGGYLLLAGIGTVLDTRRGETRGAVTDPTAPGFEAFVEQTWSMLVATEDSNGELVQVAVIAAADRGGSGGTILILPVDLVVELDDNSTRTSCLAKVCRLIEHHRIGGLAEVRNAVTAMLNVEVTGTTLLTPNRWQSLAGAVDPVEVELTNDLVISAEGGGSVVRFSAGTRRIEASEVVDFFAFTGGESASERIDRQRDWWLGWIQAVAAGNPVENLPALDLDVVHLLETVASGRVQVPAGLWVDEGNGLTMDENRLTDLVVAMFPVPIPRNPGQWPTVRLLNGTGDPSLDASAREVVLRAGVELVVVGNYRSEKVIQTRVLHREESMRPAAELLANYLGGGVLFDQMLSPVTDLTVVIGSDFRPDSQ